MVIPTTFPRVLRWGTILSQLRAIIIGYLFKRIIFLLIFLPDLEVMPVFKNSLQKSININKSKCYKHFDIIHPDTAPHAHLWICCFQSCVHLTARNSITVLVFLVSSWFSWISTPESAPLGCDSCYSTVSLSSFWGSVLPCVLPSLMGPRRVVDF